MASIFTYEPDTPRVASPWLDAASSSGIHDTSSTEPLSVDHVREGTDDVIANGGRSYNRITRLQAEPQEGPVEYKLHLLLRPRRRFQSTTTTDNISGSRHARFGVHQSSRSVSESSFEAGSSAGTATPPTAMTLQGRQHRLEQLTTQLLWRLQQSSPHHTSSATNIILPSLPEALPELQAPQEPVRLLHGLEESQGALYEIGVADDGSLIGLAEDEMQESLNNLRAMAACLGCAVEVLRTETVGQCEWVEDVTVGKKQRQIRRSGRLVVAEALVKPYLPMASPTAHPVADDDNCLPAKRLGESLAPATEQLRVTLTGPTMSGKSSLLGTLTTSTLDNGRGKSRLSMLKHRHEITSGITSSVTQELFGYQDASNDHVDVINYATENAASWIDLHVAVAGSRLVFISDSAGHPRYRRTTVRSLVGWKPHWTLLCVPADDTEDTASKTASANASQQTVDSTVSDIDLSSAQLELCLRLQLPLVVVITKLDLASRSGLRGTLSKILDALKAAGRKPAILPNAASTVNELDLQSIGAMAIESAYNASIPLLNNLLDTVPIVLTSAVQGTGIQTLHALLHELPLPSATGTAGRSESVIYHIEDVYTKPAELTGVIISGRLRSGRLSVGETLFIGPFSGHEPVDDSEDSDGRAPRRSSSHLPTSRSFPGALRDSHLTPPLFQLPNQEWRRVRVTGIRNLRLPVNALQADQVGTVAIEPEDAAGKTAAGDKPLARVRKGMVLSAIQPPATRTFSAQFRREDLEALAVGTHVVVYTASVRASAKIVSARAPDSPVMTRQDDEEDRGGHDAFSFDDMGDALNGAPRRVAGQVTAPYLLVTFKFDAAKEFIMLDDQILVMPGGGPGLYGGHERGEKGMAGLEGFVGTITESFG